MDPRLSRLNVSSLVKGRDFWRYFTDTVGPKAAHVALDLSDQPIHAESGADRTTAPVLSMIAHLYEIQENRLQLRSP